MTKREIVLKIAEKADVKQVAVLKIVQMTLDAITAALVKGETVELRNFGVFKIKNRKAKIGRNPRTGQTVPVPERKVVCFKPGLVMKEKIR